MMLIDNIMQIPMCNYAGCGTSR